MGSLGYPWCFPRTMDLQIGGVLEGNQCWKMNVGSSWNNHGNHCIHREMLRTSTGMIILGIVMNHQRGKYQLMRIITRMSLSGFPH